MKIKDLVKLLLQFNPEMDVRIYCSARDYDVGIYEPLSDKDVQPVEDGVDWFGKDCVMIRDEDTNK